MTIKSADLFLLGARVLLYAVLAVSLRSEPSAAVLGELANRLLTLKRDMAGQRLPALRRSIDAMLKALASSTPEVLAIDYADLFLSGKNGSLVPTESAYLEKMLYGQSTMEVTESYAEFGFVKESSFTEPSDHIAVECAFMAALGTELLERAGEDNQAELERLVDAQSNFLDLHMGRWVPGWAEKLKEVAGTDFYKAIAGLVSTTLATDKDLLVRLSRENWM
jgi:putative dimethyl sulfoxide reductase chaperone